MGSENKIHPSSCLGYFIHDIVFNNICAVQISGRVPSNHLGSF